jgi:hypothetical protein
VIASSGSSRTLRVGCGQGRGAACGTRRSGRARQQRRTRDLWPVREAGRSGCTGHHPAQRHADRGSHPAPAADHARLAARWPDRCHLRGCALLDSKPRGLRRHEGVSAVVHRGPRNRAAGHRRAGSGALPWAGLVGVRPGRGHQQAARRRSGPDDSRSGGGGWTAGLAEGADCARAGRYEPGDDRNDVKNSPVSQPADRLSRISRTPGRDSMLLRPKRPSVCGHLGLLSHATPGIPFSGRSWIPSPMSPACIPT